MPSMNSHVPVVLCISGLDPTGGAGLVADIQTCQALGAHTLALASVLTAQDSRDVGAIHSVPVAQLQEQLDLLLADCRPDAIKLGLLGDAQQVDWLAEKLAALRCPIVLDPVLRAGGGRELADATLLRALCEQLIPMVTLLTPNAAEARRLAPAATLTDSAQRLLQTGCQNVLITGGDEADLEVLNHWHARDAAPRTYRWPRLPETFHGAGCTLASACAALLARGMALAEAIEAAQAYVHETLSHACTIGNGRRIPGRMR